MASRRIASCPSYVDRIAFGTILAFASLATNLVTGDTNVPNLFERFVMNNSAFGIQGILEDSLWSGLKSLIASSANGIAGNVLHDAMATSAIKGGHQ